MSTTSLAARVLKFYLIAQQSPPLFPTELMILAWQPLKGLRRFNQRALQRRFNESARFHGAPNLEAPCS